MRPVSKRTGRDFYTIFEQTSEHFDTSRHRGTFRLRKQDWVNEVGIMIISLLHSFQKLQMADFPIQPEY